MHLWRREVQKYKTFPYKISCSNSEENDRYYFDNFKRILGEADLFMKQNGNDSKALDM